MKSLLSSSESAINQFLHANGATVDSITVNSGNE